jgi:phosphate transport system substrate-binding protein
MMRSEILYFAAIRIVGGSIVISSLTACSGSQLETSQLSIGTDAESAPLVEGLINGYETDNPDAVLTLQTRSREQMLTDSTNGEIDGGFIFYPPVTGELFSTVVAADMLVLIVNPSSTIEEVSSGEARSLMHGRIVNWSQLKVEALDVQVATYSTGSSSRLVLDSALLMDGEMSPAARLAADISSMLMFVASTPGSIGYLPHSSLAATVKTLTIDGAAPTFENAQNRSYPFVAQIVFVSATEPVGSLRHFLDWVLSPQGQQVVRRYGLGYND